MKRNELIHYIVRKSSNGQYLAPFNVRKGVQVPSDGKPTIENLSKWRDAFNNSLKKGGANEHLGIKYWLQCKIEIYNQYTKEIVCTYNPPMFEVIN